MRSSIQSRCAGGLRPERLETPTDPTSADPRNLLTSCSLTAFLARSLLTSRTSAPTQTSRGQRCGPSAGRCAAPQRPARQARGSAATVACAGVLMFSVCAGGAAVLRRARDARGLLGLVQRRCRSPVRPGGGSLVPPAATAASAAFKRAVDTKRFVQGR